MRVLSLIITLLIFICSQAQGQTLPKPLNSDSSTTDQSFNHRQDQPQTQKTDNSLEISDEDYQRRGIVTVKNRIRINSQIDAIIYNLPIKEGAQFKKNDLLLEFDCAIERAALEEARLAHGVAKFELEATRKKAEETPISPQTLELLKLKTELALTKLNYLRERIKHCKLFAPFAGSILKILVQKHEAATALTPVMEIVDDQPLHFRVFLPWTWLKWLAVDDTVEIEVADKNYPAKLVELSQEVDPLDQSIKALLQFQSEDEVKIGMSGVAKFKPKTM